MEALTRLWRRSIRARVVASTVFLTAIVIGITTWLLLRSVADGLAESRTEVALSEARGGFDQAETLLNATVESGAGSSQILAELVDTLASSRGESRTFDLVVEGPLSAEGGSAPVRSSAPLTSDDLPEEVVAEVRSTPGIAWQYSALSTLGLDGDDAVVIVGQRIAVEGLGDEFAFFYVFSMADQQQTLNLLRNALAWGGLALVVLVGVIAWIVARQVVGPLKLARLVAEEIASGHLDQRMEVTGEDDIARLSHSFNQMAASLQSQIRRLENLSELQQRFVSDVSHELRTPLTTVQMAADMLADSSASFGSYAQRAAELLQNELSRFEALLSNLLDLSRFDAGAAELELDAVDLAAVARRMGADEALGRAGISAVVIGADRPAMVEADARRIDRITRNLLSNAIKYSHASRIEIEIGSRHGSVSLVVRDFGVGLDPADRRRVFDRFWRADPARTSSRAAGSGGAVGGTGLGLAIAREDAALHGGLLEVYSQLGRGTEFILTLPTSLDEVSQPAVTPRFQ